MIVNRYILILYSYKNGSSNAKYPHNLPKQNTKNLSTKKPDSISDIYLKIVNSSESDEQNSSYI